MEPIPTAVQLLNVWEQGRFQTPAQRAWLLLRLAVPAVPDETLSWYGAGQRDQELLGLRERVFGPRMLSLAQCPECGHEVELDFSISELRAPAADARQSHHLQTDGYDLRFHLPLCADLAALPARGEVGGHKRALLQRCVTEARCQGEPIAADRLPAEVSDVLSRRMAELDPQGDIQLALTCPKCSRTWAAPLDIGSCLWQEIHAWAERMLREVHALAAAYGWREADILALSTVRRQAYLELIRP